LRCSSCSKLAAIKYLARQRRRAKSSHQCPEGLSLKEQFARPHKDIAFAWDETYTLTENLHLMYRLSGKSCHRELSTQFIEDDPYFGSLSRGENVLPGEYA
jgi:hypothetical protein